MQEREFNLLDEAWIMVVDKDMNTKEISLKELFANAYKYKRLAGEMPTQDFAILRLLLAIVLTVFYRYDVNGRKDELSKENDNDENDIIDRWEEYWEKGCFNSSVFDEYLETQRDRFWLFHPDTPFYQVPDLQYGTQYSAISLRGDIKGSNNKATQYHFSNTAGDNNCQIEYSEAARWLVHLIGFAVNIKADKHAPGTAKPTGTGRLGQLGLIQADGDNLFRTIMLNMVPITENGEIWNRPKPAWEMKVNVKQGNEIAPPNNLPELYTIQSRRINMICENNHVVGFRAIGGDYYNTENDFNEPMTIWQKKEDKKTKKVIYIPRKHKKEIQAWREFPAIFSNNGGHIPGLTLWLKELGNQDLLHQYREITFKITGIIYGDGMSYTYGDYVYDAITFATGLLNDIGIQWRKIIMDEIDKCKNVAAEALNKFSGDIVRYYSGKDSNKEKALREKLSSQFYSEVDCSFRLWMRSIDPKREERENTILEWERQAKKIAKEVAIEYVSSLPMNYFRSNKEEKTNITIPQILNNYYSRLNAIY